MSQVGCRSSDGPARLTQLRWAIILGPMTRDGGCSGLQTPTLLPEITPGAGRQGSRPEKASQQPDSPASCACLTPTESVIDFPEAARRRAYACSALAAPADRQQNSTRTDVARVVGVPGSSCGELVLRGSHRASVSRGQRQRTAAPGVVLPARIRSKLVTICHLRESVTDGACHR